MLTVEGKETRKRTSELRYDIGTTKTTQCVVKDKADSATLGRYWHHTAGSCKYVWFRQHFQAQTSTAVMPCSVNEQQQQQQQKRWQWWPNSKIAVHWAARTLHCLSCLVACHADIKVLCVLRRPPLLLIVPSPPQINLHQASRMLSWPVQLTPLERQEITMCWYHSMRSKW